MAVVAFHDVRFPTDVSRGMRGGPKFMTTVVGSETGWEQRIGHWIDARREWSLSAPSWSAERLAALLAFFVARQGRLHSFRFKDWTDYYAGRRLAPAVYDTPVQFGTGNGTATQFQLAKRYSSGGHTLVRQVTKIVAGTVKVFADGVEQTSGWTVAAATGVVTFGAAPSLGASLAWTGEFDCHARFDSDFFEFTDDGVFSGSAVLRVVEVRG
ncbi:MAG: DUF2460 domain-containing protein [Fimbriimonadaceae bacterium]|nr:DUF2460 domain-containing protein [Fimbriimonadaceae bacterium]QYK58005.1 MAG: DUF2460 domain-containing protein [Fimbriimonadaceae bacterium]